jgi:integrase
MPPRKCWSKTVGAERGTKVRVYEREPGGLLQIAVWVEGGTNCNRRSLGHRDRVKAEQQARAIARLRGEPTAAVVERKPATLGELFDEYLAHSTHTRQGCLKTERHRRDMAWRAVVLLRWFGHDCIVDELTRNRIAAFIRARREGQIGERTVRTRSVQVDLTFLKSALLWACGSPDDTVPLVRKNVLAGFAIPDEADPRRPLMRASTADTLLTIAPAVHPLLPLLICVIGSTGRRLGSVLGLAWNDIDFAQGTIQWRAELDKTRRTWLSPLPAVAAAALRTRRDALGSQLGAHVFPAPKNPAVPASRFLAAGWLRRAYRLAGITKERGGLWHPFRRKWATERKRYSVVDVAAAGGWRDINTLLTCYQHPDSETMRAVVELTPTPEKLSHQLSRSVQNATGAA